MPHPPLYLSPPAVLLPATRLTNEQVIARVRENYRGNPIKWPLLEAAMRRVLERCGTSIRYFEEDHEARVGDYAARAANLCLQTHRVASSDISLLIYGGVAREYFEPATAMEVAAKCGLRHVHAFDVTSACAGQLEGIHIAASYLSMHDEYRMALIGSAELTRNFLCFDIQTVKDLLTKAAGLTIGNAASAWLLGRQPFAGGSLRLLGFRNHSMPTHWHLCSAPIDGTLRPCPRIYSNSMNTWPRKSKDWWRKWDGKSTTWTISFSINRRRAFCLECSMTSVWIEARGF